MDFSNMVWLEVSEGVYIHLTAQVYSDVYREKYEEIIGMD